LKKIGSSVGSASVTISLASIESALTIFIVVGSVHVVAAASCDDLAANFNYAVAARSIDGAKRAYDGLTGELFCNKRVAEFRDKLVEFVLERAEGSNVPMAERDHALDIAREQLGTSGSWQHTSALADKVMRRGQRAEALYWYEISLSRQIVPGIQVSSSERQVLMDKAGAAKALANDDQEGKTAISFVPSTRDSVDGNIAGVYLAPRGAEVIMVPLPVYFYTNEARFTAAGERSVEEIATAAREQEVRTMTLVGHADPRGAAKHNMDLSKLRVEAVRKALILRGVTAEIVIAWKGSQQPVDTTVLSFTPTQQEIWALDRRVQWIRKGPKE
jgi:outer membrane protein OmpA-like peptidoglycan-associated protein